MPCLTPQHAIVVNALQHTYNYFESGIDSCECKRPDSCCGAILDTANLPLSMMWPCDGTAWRLLDVRCYPCTTLLQALMPLSFSLSTNYTLTNPLTPSRCCLRAPALKAVE